MTANEIAELVKPERYLVEKAEFGERLTMLFKEELMVMCDFPAECPDTVGFSAFIDRKPFMCNVAKTSDFVEAIIKWVNYPLN